jgi:hypothetical protein
MNISEVPTSRAPLATFDTVDFGEDRNSMRTLHDDSFELKSEVDSTNSEASIPFDYSTFTEDSNDPFMQDLKPDISKQEDVWSNINVKISPKHIKLSKRNSFGYQNLKEKNALSASSSSDASDSSDSECGYIKSGYVSVSSNFEKFDDSAFPCENFDSPLPQRAFLKHIADNNSSCESTPFSSPNLSRNSLPSLLTELETVTEKSKRKAIEKRIQRLQVTNKPVERPRSTTPINVVNLEEYKPEKSPSLNSEKLSIKLPPEEFRKRHKSPLRHHGDIFTFVNEDQLFTRTKSLVVETAIKPGQSPKRVLIPPTLSPLCSPCVSPRKNEHVLTDICPNKDYDVLFSTSPDKWVAFPNVSNSDTISQNNSIKSNIANEDGNYTKNNNGALPVDEDVLTISIVERDNSKTCDILLEANSKDDNRQLDQQINISDSSRGDNENLHTKSLDDIALNDSETSDLRKEIISIVNEIFDADSSLPQVFQDDGRNDRELKSSDSVCTKDEATTQTAHLLQS